MTALPLPTGRRGQALALGLTALAAALLWFGAIDPVLQAYADRTERLLGQQRLARRMEDLARTVPGLRAQATAAASTVHETAALLPGATDSLAAAALQQRLDELAKAADLRIGSEEIVPPQTDGAFRMIGVRITVHAPYRMVVALLQAMAGSDLPMVVSDLSIRVPSTDARDADAPVDSSFTVSALRAAAPGSAAPGLAALGSAANGSAANGSAASGPAASGSAAGGPTQP